MLNGLHIGRVSGIQLQVHWSWLFMFSLVTLVIGTDIIPTGSPELNSAICLLLGMVAALLLGASLLVHELAHSLTAIKTGTGVQSITLFALGGVAVMETEPTSAKDSLKVSAAGPLSSLLLSLLFLVMWLVFGDFNKPFNDMVSWLATVNLILAIFNLIPGYPLDGGRILEALTWMKTGNRRKARDVAAKGGIGVGYLFIAGGIVAVPLLNPFNGLWFIMIGFMLKSYAGMALKAPIQ